MTIIDKIAVVALIIGYAVAAVASVWFVWVILDHLLAWFSDD